jgi:hypothetical protein
LPIVISSREAARNPPRYQKILSCGHDAADGQKDRQVVARRNDKTLVLDLELLLLSPFSPEIYQFVSPIF